jgi:tRNA A-37 threonylcarbamoyl transferase component Bud32/tetratricopeptide (TPR) repeat protein
MTLAPGSVVAGRFEIEALAGEGGMGTVYRARDRDRGETVALKIFLTHAEAAPEARTLLELAHPNIVRCVAFGTTTEGSDYLATEWLEGETLRARLLRGPLTVAQTIRIARRVAEGLAAAHAWGITHRDVTPANIMLRANQQDSTREPEVKLLDFGLAVHGRAEGAAGTVGYAAPEQARGDVAPSPRADVFSLGCVMVECLLGEKPFEAETDVGVIARMLEGDTARVTTRLTNVPVALARLLARMLAADPESRPRDGAAIAMELAVFDRASAPALSAVRSSELRWSDLRGGSEPRGSVTDAEERACEVLVAAGVAVGSPRLRAELEALGADITFDEGRITCTWAIESSAVERAVRGARGALAVRRFDVHARASLVAGKSAVSGFVAALDTLPVTPSIRVDADTARLLGDRFVIRPESNDAALGELVLLREGASPHSRTSLLGRETRCVGRDREIGLVVSTFDECTEEPDARIVWITGPPGIGKTRVRDEVLAKIAASARVPQVWSAQADPTHAGVVLGVIADLVRSAASIGEGARDDDAQRAALESRVGASVAEADRPRVVEFLSELLDLPVAQPSAQLRAAREEPLLMGDQIRRAFEDLVVAELGRGPLALVVEDLQWSDAASVRAIADLARVARDRPLFVLLLGRPEAKDTHLRLVADRQPTGVALGKLGTKAMEKLVTQALGEAPDAALVASIVERAGGNPFFAEELVRATSPQSGAPSRRTGAATETTTAALAMLESRLTSLEPEARRVLRAGSVFGAQFASADVAVLLGEEASREFVDAWCAWLAEREVLTQNGAAWTFRHALVRDAAYGMLTEDDRKTAHAHAAEILERALHAPGPVIAEHWSQAGELDRAARWLATSATGALEANDLTACVDLGERALVELEDDEIRGELLVVLTEAHRWRGDYDASAARAREAIDLLPRGSARFYRAVSELASIAGSVGSPEDFEAAIGKLDATPGDSDASSERQRNSVAASIAWSRAAMQLIVRGDARALPFLERAEVAAESDLARGRVEQAFAVRAGVQGELEELARRYQASVTAFERAGDTRSACMQELNLASSLCDLGKDAEARARLDHGAREAEARGLSTVIALAHHLDGILRAREGLIDDAIKAQKRALETFAAQGNARMEGGVRTHLAELFLRRNMHDDALRESLASAELLSSIPPARARALAVLALIHLARGSVDAALAASAEALSLAESSGVEGSEAVVWTARAEALAASGSPDAPEAREKGRKRLVARAAAITDARARETYLAVPENARLLAP